MTAVVIVYFHGGGFLLFSAASRPYHALCRRICSELGAVVVSVNYRLAPQHRFPAAYDDGVAALRYLDVNALPADVVPAAVDLSSCFLAGDSAGGNIVHHVAQRWASASAASPPVSVLVAGAVLIQTFFGGEERTDAEVALNRATPSLSMAVTDHYWREFLPEGATRDHAAARVCGDGVELSEAFPPSMVVVGGFDVLKDRGKGKLVRVVEYPDAVHGFHVFPELADSGKLLEEMKLFVDAHRSERAVSMHLSSPFLVWRFHGPAAQSLQDPVPMCPPLFVFSSTLITEQRLHFLLPKHLIQYVKEKAGDDLEGRNWGR